MRPIILQADNKEEKYAREQSSRLQDMVEQIGVERVLEILGDAIKIWKAQIDLLPWLGLEPDYIPDLKVRTHERRRDNEQNATI